MVEFVEGELDVLVATTIVESGLDIPRANTMFVARADAFGLAQLYQLRGRIGRSKERAYCYLLVPEPEHITDEARRRLEALQRFTELGAGFQIASQDLEIRGGGELLGAKQSGSIAAVGFDQYVRDARRGGRRAARRADPQRGRSRAARSRCPASSPTTTSPIPASASSSTSGCPRSTTTTSCSDVMAEIADRYGPLPGDVDPARRADGRQGDRAPARRARARDLDARASRSRCPTARRCTRADRRRLAPAAGWPVRDRAAGAGRAGGREAGLVGRARSCYLNLS